MPPFRYIDLFSGMGGFRQGLENFKSSQGIDIQCVLSAEIKPSAQKVYTANFGEHTFEDVTKINSSLLPDFDLLMAGFPCQPFSYLGKQLGFAETRGTLFFEIERILKDKSPSYFILENVKGLLTHDNGNTFKIILNKLSQLPYHVQYRVFSSTDFGIPQKRERLYIVGSKQPFDLDIPSTPSPLMGDVINKNNLNVLTNESPNYYFLKKLTDHFSLTELEGKLIVDMKHSKKTIHSWDFGLFGEVEDDFKKVLCYLAKEKHMGKRVSLEKLIALFPLIDIPEKLNQYSPYVSFKTNKKGETGWSSKAGGLSFPFQKVLSLKEPAPTLTATETKLVLVPIYDNNGNPLGLRQLDNIELARLSGFPENFKLPVSKNQIMDLYGNTVCPQIVTALLKKIINISSI